MRIGIVIGRIGGIDGVALETEKWITVLKRLGHDISVATGLCERPLEGINVTIIPELNFYHPLTIREQKNAFFDQNCNEKDMFNQIKNNALHIENEVMFWMIKNKIEKLLTENCTALPCHLAMGMALNEILSKTGVPCVSHDHDFAWERGTRYDTKFASIEDLKRLCFPTKVTHVEHVVINTQAQTDLKERFDIDSIIAPNVMDFDETFGDKNEHNQNLLHDLNLSKEDILLFQITRIVRRKGIETAIDLIHQMKDPRLKLIITGSALDDHNKEYYCELFDLVQKLKLKDQVRFASEYFANYRDKNARNIHGGYKQTIYSLSDAYAYANGCTYFSTYEGFGNAFVEAVLAKKPIFVNNYKPVYMPDIGSKGFKTVMIEDNILTEKSVADIAKILYDRQLAEEIGDYNFELGKKHFSYDVLERILSPLF